MAAEIERKFVLAARPAALDGAERVEIEQGYLAITPEIEVRLRRADAERTLTAKAGHGETREEVEVELAAGAFERLWALTAGRRLRKRRSRVPLDGGLVAEVDEYEGGLAGLRVAEVEFPTEPAARAFHPPAWLGREVTGEAAYANQALAVDGLPTGRDQAGAGDSAAMADELPEEKRPGYRLENDEPVPDGLRRVAVGRVRRAVERLDEPGEDQGKAIHGARKDLKKLRSVLRLVRAEIGEKRYGKLNRRFRDAGRLLSESRDAEVKVETLADLEERFGDEFPADSAIVWRSALERERYAGAADPEGEVAERREEAARLIEGGREELARLPLEKDSWSAVAPGLLRAYDGGRKSLRAVRRHADPDSVHEWRKRTKDLWYHLRLLHDLWPGLLGATVDEAHDLADLLGDHHDLAVLAEDLGERPVADPKPLEALIARRQAELLDRALLLGTLLYAEKPPAFAKRLKAYWKASRA